MHYKIEAIPGINEKSVLSLNSCGVYNTDELLNWAQTPLKREKLSRKCGMKVKEITRCTSIADLLRIKGVGPKYACLLVDSGNINSVQELLQALSVGKTESESRNYKRVAERDSVKLAAESLIDSMRKEKEQNHLTGKLPSTNDLIEIGEEANEIRPRLVMKSPDDSGSFHKFIEEKLKRESRPSRKINMATIGILTIAIGFLLIFSYYRFNSLINQRYGGDSELDKLTVQFFREYLHFKGLNLLVIIAIILFGLVLLLIFYDATNRFQNTYMLSFLFNRDAYRDFYFRVAAVDLKKQLRGIRWGIIVLALLALLLVLITIAALEEATPIEQVINLFSLPVALGGVIIAVVVSIPLLTFFLRDMRKDHGYDEAGVKRFLMYFLSKAVMLPILILLLVKFVLPVGITLHTEIFNKIILPGFKTNLLEVRNKISSLNIHMQEEAHRKIILDTLDRDVLNQIDTAGLIISDKDTMLMEVVIPSALNMVIWITLAAYFLLFVLPYLILGGWRKGIFFLVILAISFIAEEYLSEFAPTWFSLPSGSLPAGLIIAFFIFANALLFDWLYTMLTERTKVCPGCHTKLNSHYIFCVSCGLQQI